MRSIYRGLASALLVTAFLTAPVRAEEKEKPDGTIHLVSKSVNVGVGFSWGKGTLRYKGAEHAISVDGLTVGSVGASEVTANGEVYHLKKLSDFNGTYAAVTAAATAGGGGDALVMKNQNGVVVELKGTSQGIKFELGASGVKLAIKK